VSGITVSGDVERSSERQRSDLLVRSLQRFCRTPFSRFLKEPSLAPTRWKPRECYLRKIEMCEQHASARRDEQKRQLCKPRGQNGGLSMVTTAGSWQ
jgi:hypothetical protein